MIGDLLNKIPDGWFTSGYVLGASIFLLTELAALARAAPGDTFSEKVYGFLEVGPARYILVGATLLWLTIHFLWRGRLG